MVFPAQAGIRGLQIRQTESFSPRDIYARGEAYRLPQDAAWFDFHPLVWPWQGHGDS